VTGVQGTTPTSMAYKLRYGCQVSDDFLACFYVGEQLARSPPIGRYQLDTKLLAGIPRYDI
jgi:hypothetical protein